MPTTDLQVLHILIGLVLASVLLGGGWALSLYVRATKQRFCRCDYFVPNRHDEKCAVCRLPEDEECEG